MKIMVFQDFEGLESSGNGCNGTSGPLEYAYLCISESEKNNYKKIIFDLPIFFDGFR